jgi:hypothetical protein
VHQRVPDLLGQLLPELIAGHRRAVRIRGEYRVVVVGQRFGEPLSESRVGGQEDRLAGAEPAHRAHRDDPWCQPLGYLVKHALVAGATAIDLVDEEQRRDA